MSDDRDWTWLSERGQTIAAQAAPETLLHALVKDTRRAELRVRAHRHGHELRCLFGEPPALSVLWTELFRPGHGRELGAVAAETVAAWQARGWVLDAQAEMAPSA